MSAAKRQPEDYICDCKQHCGVERAQVRAARAQRNHLTCALRAFLRLEQPRLVTRLRWWEAKAGSIRAAVRRYLAQPRYTLISTANPTALRLVRSATTAQRIRNFRQA